MTERLRLCRATRIVNRRHKKPRPCRAFACRDGYCWWHHLAVHGSDLWGDHWWTDPGYPAPPTCEPEPPGLIGNNPQAEAS